MPSGKKGGRAGEVYALFAETGDVAADEVSTITEPQTKWLEQQLIEAVMGAHALKQTGGWSAPELAELWSESALTAAVLPR